MRTTLVGVLALVVALVAASPALARPVVDVGEFALPADAVGPFGISPGPRSSMWFGAGDFVGRVRADGTVVTYKVPTAGANVGWVSHGSDGRLWFAERGGNKIGRIDGRGRIQEIAIPTVDSQPHSIVFDRAGTPWFTEFGGNKIGQVNRDWTITEFPLPQFREDSGPLGMVLGPDDALWFTERTAERIGRFDPATGRFREYPLAPGANPQRITVGADGAFWFTEASPARIGRITVDGQLTEFPLRAGSGPVGITSAGDGGIWFTEYNSARIGRMDLSGIVTAEYQVPTPDSRPIQIAVEPGRGTILWFTEQAANQIGRLTLGRPRGG